jgi:hypothetical protein
MQNITNYKHISSIAPIKKEVGLPYTVKYKWSYDDDSIEVAEVTIEK